MGQIDNKGDGIFLQDGTKISLDSTTITIGASSSQTIGLFGATAVAQQTEAGLAGDTNASVSGAGTAAYINTAYTSSVGTSNYTVADIVKALKRVGILAQ